MACPPTSKRQETSAMAALPPEMWYEVCGWLRASDLVRLGETSKLMREISSSPHLWSSLCRSEWPPEICLPAVYGGDWRALHSDQNWRNRLFDSGIRAAVRVRPLSEDEEGQAVETIVEGSRITFVGDVTREFTFDEIFDSMDAASPAFASQARTCRTLGHRAAAALDMGLNACVIAYGATGSGKSHTMLGHPYSPGNLRDGVVGECLARIFRRPVGVPEPREVTMTVVTIHQHIYDLLGDNRPFVKLRQVKDPPGVIIEDVAERSVDSVAAALEVLAGGLAARHMTAKNIDPDPSRSHLIVQVRVVTTDDEGEETVTRATFCDLAGSERRSKINSMQTLGESSHVRSLGSLGSVLSALRHGRKHVPWRDSPLTRLLQPCLQGPCCTCIVAVVPPTGGGDDSLSTLRFAHRAPPVVVEARVLK